MTTQTIEATQHDTLNSETTHFQTLMHSDIGGAWMREACLALALAAQAHIRLDEEQLIYSDVRDLMALQRRLRGGRA
ncbi:MAG TPA: hypothetical protein VF739_05700 [Ktedonobacterales bacterium]